MVRTLFLSILAGALMLGTACGDDSSDNNGSSNITPGNTMTSANNDTTNVTTNNANNMTTNNGMTTNNTNNPLACIALNPALEGECDVLCQTDCGSSESCVIGLPTPDAAMYTSSCVSPGGAAEGMSCTESSECAAGFGCAEARDGSGKACFPYCRAGGPEDPKCEAGFECVPFQREIRVGTCQPEAEGCMLFPDSCGDGEACYYNPDGPRECGVAGGGDLEDECTTSADCGEELRCIDPGTGTTICEFYCNPSPTGNQSAGCPESQTCEEQTDSEGNSLGWGICV